MPPIISRVARRVREVREARGLTRQQLADKLDLTYLQVYRVENGTKPISADDLPAWAEALDTTVTSLYREARAS